MRHITTIADLLAERMIPIPDGLAAARVERPGRFEALPLPLDHPEADLIIFIPAFSRQLSDDGRSLGTLPQLVRDLAACSGREGKGIAVLVSDDSPPEDAALNERALSLALDRINDPPPIWFVGQEERERTFREPENLRLLERLLRAELAEHGTPKEKKEFPFHLRTLEFLVTHHGYGPQRVRGQGMTFGVAQPVMSRDSDLTLVQAAATPDLAARAEFNFEAGFGFIFADARLESRLAVQHDPEAPFLSRIDRSGLGLDLNQLRQRHPELKVWAGLRINKDQGLERILARPEEPTGVELAADSAAGMIPPDAFVVSVTAHKWGAADINGHKALLNALKMGREALAAVAIPAVERGTSTDGLGALLVEKTPNPDCAVETAMATEPRRMLPWLVTRPDIGGEGGELLQHGARAEDQLRANNTDPRLIFAYTGEALHHARAQRGRRENAVQTFISEDLGDMLAGLVRRRLSFDAASDQWLFNAPSLTPGRGRRFEEDIFERELRPEVEKMWARGQTACQALTDGFSRKVPHLRELEQIAGEFDQHCTEDYQCFELRVADYLAQQLRFVRSVFLCYPILLRGLREIRRAGRFYARLWRRPGASR